MAIVTLAEAKALLNKTLSNDDAELAVYLDAATEVVEGLCGPCSVQTFTETVPGGSSLLLSHRPVVAVQTVAATAAGVTSPVAPGALVIDGAAGVASTPAGAYVGDQVVTYTAGRTVVPASLKLAAAIIVGHLWDTQRPAGGGGRRVPGGGDDVSVVMGYAIPNRALELMNTYRLPDGFA